MKKTVTWVVLTLLLAGTVLFAIGIKPAGAAAVTVYINSDGSVTPSSAPISSVDNITYTFTGNISYPTYNGIVVGRSNIVINGNGYTVRGNQSANGFRLTSISNVTIKNTNIENCREGIYLSSSNNNTINGNKVTANNLDGIFLGFSSNYNIVSGNNATANGYYGIFLLASSNYNIVSGNNATANSLGGIYLGSSSNNTVSGNNGTANGYYGIYLYSSSNNSIMGNNITANNQGILFNSSSNNIFSGNNATANGYYGIHLWASSNNTVSGNTVRNNNDSGIYLDSSSNNTVSGNNATANSYYGIYLGSSSNYNIASGNNATANSLDGIYLYSSSNNTLMGNNATANSMVGIYLDYSSNNTVSGNNATANSHTGIYLYTCSNNTVGGNNATANSYYGIYLYSSSNNTLMGNNATANSYYGIYLYTSSNNTVSENNATANSLEGISLYSSSNNIVYHNNFVNNTIQVGSSNSTNTWDDGYPSGGNYWSNYTGTDLSRGTYQNITGSDGIGDTAYTIALNESDRYPLMGPFGTSTATGLNVTVFPAPDVAVIFENVTGAGSTTVNKTQTGPAPPPGSTLVGQYYNITTTADISGNATIRITYDDSNLTQAQENSLQLLQWCLQRCDVTGATGVPDGVVNMRDIGYFCSKFMTTPSSPNWDPRCDVTGPGGVPDGVVNMRDIGEACSEFMKTSNWADITTYVDTVNNVIYGETSHFSMFGVTRE